MCNTILRCDNLTFTLTCIPKPRSKHETPSFASFVLYVRVCTVLAYAQASQTTHLLTKPSISHPHESYAGCKASMSYRQNIRSTTPPVIRKHSLPKYPTATLQAGSNAPSLATPPNPQRKTQKPRQTHTATPKPTSPPIPPSTYRECLHGPIRLHHQSGTTRSAAKPPPCICRIFLLPAGNQKPPSAESVQHHQRITPANKSKSRKAEKLASWFVGMLASRRTPPRQGNTPPHVTRLNPQSALAYWPLGGGGLPQPISR